MFKCPLESSYFFDVASLQPARLRLGIFENQIAQATDDRSEAEKAQLGRRWSTSPMYLEENRHGRDIDRGLDPKAEELGREYASLLQSSGIDPVLARYFAVIHLRDPLYLEARDGNPDAVTPENVHLSLLASFYSHVRLKVPEPKSPHHGWRVEFRPMELQPTEFANAAILVFLNLLKQALAWLGPEVQLWMPLELVEENIQRAHARDAVIEQMFWFPKNPLQGANGEAPTPRHDSTSRSAVEMTISEIVNGNAGTFPGLLPLVRRYLDFVRQRATGEEPTPAAWMRRFVQKHPSYKKDSVVGPYICYDMLREMAHATG